MNNTLPFPTPPLSLYLHLPWCLQKCPYCDFNSHALSGADSFSRYIDALVRDLELERALIGEREIVSIFLGGGTPSLFPALEIGRLLESVIGIFNCADGMEVTLEANPGAAEIERFDGYRRAGVNRLSIGVQSFSDRMLALLGRVHDAAEASQAVKTARSAGFDNLNLDLMFGLPQQSHQEAVADIECAVACAPEHISYYQLTLEPNTQFAAFPPKLPDDQSLWLIQQESLERLFDSGYQQYEISAFAKSHKRCAHNLNYWQFGDYLGIGAGAHGKISCLEKGVVQRRNRIRGPGQYMQYAGSERVVAESRELSVADLRLEFAMNALRLNEGFSASLFSQRTGLPISEIEEATTTASQRGLLTSSQGCFRTTELGWRFLNDLLGLFFR